MQMQLPDDGRQPWERIPGEPSLWFDRFIKYARSLGYEYLLRRAYQMWRADQPSSVDAEAYELWQGVEEQYKWSERARAWAEEDTKQLEIKWKRRRLELLEDDWTSGSTLRKTATDFLKALPLHKEIARVEIDGREIVTLQLNITAGQLAVLMKTASDLQRLAISEPTAITQDKSGPRPFVYLPEIQPMPATVPTNLVPPGDKLFVE